MSVATLSNLLSTSSSRPQWLLFATFFLFSLPALLPLLFLLSFFAFMLLLPLGCALVGFLSWQRLRKPTTTTESLLAIQDEPLQERISDESVVSSISDAESTPSEYELNEIQALEGYPPEHLHECKANYNRAYHDKEINEPEMLLDADMEIIYDQQTSASYKSEKGYDTAEPKGFDNAESQDGLLIMTDTDGALSCTEEEVLFSEMQLELEIFESMYQACEVEDHVDWIDAPAPHAGGIESESKDADMWKRSGKASSNSSILSSGTTGSVSMMSSTMSSSSSTSTWSAGSEDQSSKKSAGGSMNRVYRSGRKVAAPQCSAGKRSGVAVADECRSVGMVNKGSVEGRIRAKAREGSEREWRTTANASRGGKGGGVVVAQRGARAAPACNRSEVSKCRVKVDGGKADSAIGGSVGVKRGGGVTNRGGSGGGGAAAVAVRARKLGVKRVSAEIESSRASREEQQAMSDSNHYYSKGKVSSGGKATRVTTTTHQQQQHSSNRHVSSNVGSQSTAELEDVRRRLVHAQSEEKTSQSPAPMRTASDSYPQLLEYWRSIEQAFLRQPTTPVAAPPQRH